MSESARQGRPSGGLIPGLVKGLATTARSVTRRHHTVEYPDAKPTLPPRTRGVIALTEENCTSCMLCARECPDWCIYIDSHKEEIPATTPGGRARQRNVLDRFAIDFSLCMYCGICIEVCPFDALHWSPEFEYSELDIRDLLHEKDRLAQWMSTVPPPPALDPGSPEPAELTALNRPARPAPGAARTGAAGGAGDGAPAGRPARPATARRAPAAPGERPARARVAAPETSATPEAAGDASTGAPAGAATAPGTTPPPAVEPPEPAHTVPQADEAAPERPAHEAAPATPAEQATPGAAAGDQTQPMPKATGPAETQQLPRVEGHDETQTLPGAGSSDETQKLPITRPEEEDS